MSGQDSDETPIAFHDVAAYFSEEDWKLLHQWQKELYTNVMKEIHEALISLGYQITNPEVLLRINKGEEAYTQDLEDSERREYIDDMTSSCYPTVHPDILFRITPEKELCLGHGCDLEEAEINNSHSIGVVATSVYSLSAEEEEEMCLIDPKDSQRIYSNHGLSIQQVQIIPDHPIIPSVMPFAIKEEGSIHSLDYQYPERRKNVSNSTVLADPVVTTVFSPSLNRKEERAFEEQQKPDGQAMAGNAIKNTKRNGGEAAKCIQRTQSCKVSLGTVKVEMLRSSEKGTTSVSQLCSESNPELGGERTAPCEGGLIKSVNSILCWGIPKLEDPDACNEYMSDLRDATLLATEENAQQRLRPYQCNACGIRFSRRVHLITHQITHTGETGETPYQCTECEASFSQKIHLLTHQKTHVGNRQHKCSECEKSYNSNTHLRRHMKTHTGDKPFQCTECGKRYGEKGTLTRHYRSHLFSLNKDATKRQIKPTGGRPDKSEKSFSQKRDHFQHQRTRTEKRPHQCTECGKSYDTNQQLTRHKTTHMEERPYQCTECQHRFKKKVILTRHQRTHTGEKPFQCSECEKSYTQKQHLVRHQRTHMVIEESIGAGVSMTQPNELETVKWTIEGNNELVSVPGNSGSTIA